VLPKKWNSNIFIQKKKHLNVKTPNKFFRPTNNLAIHLWYVMERHLCPYSSPFERSRGQCFLHALAPWRPRLPLKPIWYIYSKLSWEFWTGTCTISTTVYATLML